MFLLLPFLLVLYVIGLAIPALVLASAFVQHGQAFANRYAKIPFVYYLIILPMIGIAVFRVFFIPMAGVHFLLELVIPGALVGGFAGYFVGLAMANWYRRFSLSKNLCHQCGYNLTGNVSGRCPECGVELAEDQRTD